MPFPGADGQVEAIESLREAERLDDIAELDHHHAAIVVTRLTGRKPRAADPSAFLR